MGARDLQCSYYMAPMAPTVWRRLLVVPALAAAPRGRGSSVHLCDLQCRVPCDRAYSLLVRPLLAARLQAVRGGALKKKLRLGRQQRPAPLPHDVRPG